MQTVARMIGAAQCRIGAQRQVFFVCMGGFDTHDAQNRNQADLMARLSHAMGYFDTTLGAIGARNQRHHLHRLRLRPHLHQQRRRHRPRLGLAPLRDGRRGQRRRLYGRFPKLALEEHQQQQFRRSPNQLGNGNLLPDDGRRPVGATLGKWFGASDTQLLTIFPNLHNFPATSASW